MTNAVQEHLDEIARCLRYAAFGCAPTPTLQAVEVELLLLDAVTAVGAAGGRTDGAAFREDDPRECLARAAALIIALPPDTRSSAPITAAAALIRQARRSEAAAR